MVLLVDEKLIHLDPHCSQNCVDVLQDNFPLEVSLSYTSGFLCSIYGTLEASFLDCSSQFKTGFKDTFLSDCSVFLYQRFLITEFN